MLLKAELAPRRRLLPTPASVINLPRPTALARALRYADKIMRGKGGRLERTRGVGAKTDARSC
eukprot:5937936-Pleurochrysis_carterae.AAC.2